jgi:hypothetical protein
MVMLAWMVSLQAKWHVWTTLNCFAKKINLQGGHHRFHTIAFLKTSLAIAKIQKEGNTQGHPKSPAGCLLEHPFKQA